SGGFAFSPDSKTLATTRRLNYFGTLVSLYQMPTGKEMLMGHTESIDFLAVSTDGNILTTRAEDGALRQWDMATGKQRHQVALPVLEQFRHYAALSLDGRTLAMGTRHENKLQIWDTLTAKAVRQIEQAQPDVAGLK